MKALKLVSMSVLLTSLATGSMVVHADDTAQDGTLKTNGQIQYREADEDNGETIDPNPGPEEVIVPPTQDGAFAIAYVGDYDFGSRQNSALDQSYPAAAWWFDIDEESTDFPNPDMNSPWVNEATKQAARAQFAQVRDLREDLTGWNLALKQEAQFTNGERSLNGAQVKFANGTAQNTSDELPTINSGFTLIPENSRVIMTAGSNIGYGLSTAMWGDKANLVQDSEVDGGLANPSVQLSVPGTTRTDANSKYTTNLLWTLSATPANIN